MTKPEHEIDPYWQDDLPLGEGVFYKQPHTIRMAFHLSQERYYNRDEFFPLESPTGTRLYFHAKPYLSLPDFTANVRWQSGIGRTELVEHEGARKEFIGNAQGWYYPKEQSLMLWECFLENRHRITNPLDDENLATVWRGFEKALLQRSNGVSKLYTTWEDIYNRPIWERFLRQQGFVQTGRALFAKEIGQE